MGSLAGAMAPVGLLLAAPVAEILGIRAWYGLGGMACILMGSVGFMIPAILDVEASQAGQNAGDPGVAPTGGVPWSKGAADGPQAPGAA